MNYIALRVACRRFWMLLLVLLPIAPTAHATLTFQLHVTAIRTSTNDFFNGARVFLVFPNLSADSNSVPLTTNRVFSSETNLQFTLTSSNFNGALGLINTDLNEVIFRMTNGLWTLIINEGHPTAQTNTFRIAISGLTSNIFPEITVLSPADGSSVSGLFPAYQWLDNTGWTNTQVELHPPDYSTFASDYLPPGSTSWTNAPSASAGTNFFKVRYETNGLPQFSFTTPTNMANGQPLTNWIATTRAFTQRDVLFTTLIEGGGSSAELKGHFSFNNLSFLGEDISGLGNHILSSSSCGGGFPFAATNAGITGSAVAFNGTNWMTFNTNLAAALSGDFSVSLWFRTTGTFGGNDDPAFLGAGILSAAEYESPANWTIPMALTGSKLSFLTSTPDFAYVNSRSTTDINTGTYVHLAVTRVRATGTMMIYVNGQQEALTSGPTNLFTNFTSLALGHLGNCFNGTTNLIDDVQIYTGVLTSNQVAYLFANPGATPPANTSLGEAVDAPQFTWFTGGGAPWIAQTNVTADNTDAAESGGVSGFQTSWIETTVQGPGIISFQWKIAATNFDYLEFYIDGQYQNYIDGESGWWGESYRVPGGSPKTLRWEYFADNSTPGNTNRAWLDDVFFTPIGPVELLTVSNNNGGLRLRFQSNDGFEHVVQYRDSYQTGNWFFFTNFIGNGSILEFVQPPTNVPARFFRVVTQ
jgi:hypothetical protein